MIDKCEEFANKLDNKIVNLPKELQNNMENRLIKVIQKKEDAENGVQRKQKFKFKTDKEEEAKNEVENLKVQPILSVDEINAKIYSDKTPHNFLLIYEDEYNPLKPLQLVKIIMDQINLDIRKFRKRLQKEVT